MFEGCIPFSVELVPWSVCKNDVTEAVTMVCSASLWASCELSADKLVTWFTGWEWPWKAVGHGSHMAQFGTDVVVFGTHVR